MMSRCGRAFWSRLLVAVLGTALSIWFAELDAHASPEVREPVLGAQPVAPPKPLAESLTGKAKQSYDIAVMLHGSGDLQGASWRFLSAHDESGDVRLLWNAAVCEQGMRHYSKAIDLVRRYLDSRSPLITAEAEQGARAFLDAALPLTARLVVSSSEPGARLFVDDESMGTFPFQEPPRVDFGTRRIAVEKSGFVSYTQRLTVTSSDDVHLNVKLARRVHQGRLVVKAGHQDAIFVDRKLVGIGTFGGALPSGNYALRVTAEGARPFEHALTIEDDRTRAIDVTLQRENVMSGIPTWLWVAGGVVLAAGATTGAYFALSSGEESPDGSTADAQVHVPLRGP